MKRIINFLFTKYGRKMIFKGLKKSATLVTDFLTEILKKE